MIVGIGCDSVSHNLTKKLDWESDSNTRKRFFSEKELALYEQKKSVKFLAGRFAAKEAVLKCLGTGVYDGVSLTDIEILKSDTGHPVVELMGLIKELADKLGITIWHISITHSGNGTTAFVVAER